MGTWTELTNEEELLIPTPALSNGKQTFNH